MERGEYAYYYFINQVVGGFVRSMADFFGTELYTRSTEVVIGTFEKMVQHYKNRAADGGERHAPKFPFLTFDPGLDFEPEDRAGRFFYQYPNFQVKFASKLFGPVIYDDGNVKISPVLNRYRGTFELTLWCGSVYEVIDMRVLTYQFFGGIDRYIYPRNIEGYFILPEELVFYTYNNPYTKQSYQLNWQGSDLSQILIKNINQNKYTFPFIMRPYVKLVNTSDGAEKFGGAGDEISEHKLFISLEWECEFPTHLIFIATKVPAPWHNIIFEMDVGAGYRRVPPNVEGSIPTEEMLVVGDATSSSGRSIQTVSTRLRNTYNYILTQDDVDILNNGDNPVITLLEPLLEFDPIFLKILGKQGPMNYGLQWILTSAQTIELVGFSLQNLMSAGDTILIAEYERIT